MKLQLQLKSWIQDNNGASYGQNISYIYAMMDFDEGKGLEPHHRGSKGP